MKSRAIELSLKTLDNKFRFIYWDPRAEVVSFMASAKFRDKV